jgi:hypothetical protein
MSQKQRKIKSVFTYFNDSSPDFALVSYISLLMSSNYLEYRNYFKIMQKSKFSIDEYDDDETLYIVLSLALMYKNDTMQDFLYKVLKLPNVLYKFIRICEIEFILLIILLY